MGEKYSSQFLYYIYMMLFISDEREPLCEPPANTRSATSETILHRRSLISLDRRPKRAIDGVRESPPFAGSAGSRLRPDARAERSPVLFLIPFATLIRLDANLNL